MKLNKNITNKKLKDYGFRYDNNGNYRYYLPCYKWNGKTTIYAYFYANIEEDYFSFEIQSNGTIYYPYYQTSMKSKVNHIIKDNIDKELNNFKKKGILEDED